VAKTECARKYCSNFAVIIVEPNTPLCAEHDRLEKEMAPVLCKHCRVPMMSKNNFHPLLGKQHKKSCPRRRNMN